MLGIVNVSKANNLTISTPNYNDENNKTNDNSNDNSNDTTNDNDDEDFNEEDEQEFKFVSQIIQSSS